MHYSHIHIHNRGFGNLIAHNVVQICPQPAFPAPAGIGKVLLVSHVDKGWRVSEIVSAGVGFREHTPISKAHFRVMAAGACESAITTDSGVEKKSLAHLHFPRGGSLLLGQGSEHRIFICRGNWTDET